MAKEYVKNKLSDDSFMMAITIGGNYEAGLGSDYLEVKYNCPCGLKNYILEITDNKPSFTKIYLDPALNN